MMPVMRGESAAPLDSMKYWIDMAVLRISGSATSLTVDVTFGEDMGINNAVTPSMIPNNALLPTGIFNVIKSKIAPISTPNSATLTRPFCERLKKKSPNALQRNTQMQAQESPGPWSSVSLTRHIRVLQPSR